MDDVLIIGGGSGGLTPALELHQRKISGSNGAGQAVISPKELAALSERYKQVAGYDRPGLQGGKPQ